VPVVSTVVCYSLTKDTKGGVKEVELAVKDLGFADTTLLGEVQAFYPNGLITERDS
jgi:hypothetical protein